MVKVGRLCLTSGKKPEKKFQGGKGARAPQILINDCFKKGVRDFPPPNLAGGNQSPILQFLSPANAVLLVHCASCCMQERCYSLARLVLILRFLRRCTPACTGVCQRLPARADPRLLAITGPTEVEGILNCRVTINFCYST